jgi:hypothetical protein
MSDDRHDREGDGEERVGPGGGGTGGESHGEDLGMQLEHEAEGDAEEDARTGSGRPPGDSEDTVPFDKESRLADQEPSG